MLKETKFINVMVNCNGKVILTSVDKGRQRRKYIDTLTGKLEVHKFMKWSSTNFVFNVQTLTSLRGPHFLSKELKETH